MAAGTGYYLPHGQQPWLGRLGDDLLMGVVGDGLDMQVMVADKVTCSLVDLEGVTRIGWTLSNAPYATVVALHRNAATKPFHPPPCALDPCLTLHEGRVT